MYLSAQSKKMRAFEGYKRKAIVCIPEQNTLKERMEERKNAGIELPYNTICDMKSQHLNVLTRPLDLRPLNQELSGGLRIC